MKKKGIYERYIKRLLDIAISLALLIVLSPVIIVVAILVKINLGSPVIFKQKRPGKDERIFTMYKFRTMTDKRDGRGNLVPDDMRLTVFGRALRASSCDELLELVNIFKGDMSIVGPRPQLVRDMVFMTEEQRKRHSVRAGLTGLAQVNGRNSITWEEKFEWDLRYIDNITFITDCKVVLQTAFKVLKRSDIERDGTSSDIDYGDWLLLLGKIDGSKYGDLLKKAEKMLEDNC